LYPVSDPQLIIDSHTQQCTSPSALSSGATLIYLFDAYIFYASTFILKTSCLVITQNPLSRSHPY